MRATKIAVGAALLAWSGLMFAAGYVARWATSPIEVRVERIYGGSNPHALLDEAWAYVEQHFVGVVPSDTVREYGAIRGALATLNDPYTTFSEPLSRSIERDHMRGEFGGIGVQFSLNDKGQIILKPRPDGPAAQAGVQEGDILIAINGQQLPSPARLEDAAALRGEEGKPVTIEVLRRGQRLRFTIIRARIELASVEHRLVTATVGNATAPVGYIALRAFTERTDEELQRAIEALEARAVQGYVLDLRDNSGGLLSSAVDVASRLVTETVVAIEQRRGQAEILHRTRSGITSPTQRKPLVVLVNQHTASAAEIVAAAVQAQRRGLLVGQRTFGKGSVQLVFELRDGSAVRVTAARWLTSARQALDGNGLTPDVLVEGDAEAQLRAALNALAPSLAAR
ncbi:MAG: S41 family peptidase [Anaerolineae bacterium]|nr:S41 family peptidase [Thermoflexales bacterium]MDW8395651.1 S41 family peptidase [Anaerolineae bacterium]